MDIVLNFRTGIRTDEGDLVTGARHYNRASILWGIRIGIAILLPHPDLVRAARDRRGLPQGLVLDRRLLLPPGRVRARSHCRFVLPLINFIQNSLTYSVPLILTRQCDLTLGRVHRAADARGGAGGGG